MRCCSLFGKILREVLFLSCCNAAKTQRLAVCGFILCGVYIPVFLCGFAVLRPLLFRLLAQVALGKSFRLCRLKNHENQKAQRKFETATGDVQLEFSKICLPHPSNTASLMFFAIFKVFSNLKTWGRTWQYAPMTDFYRNVNKFFQKLCQVRPMPLSHLKFYYMHVKVSCKGTDTEADLSVLIHANLISSTKNVTSMLKQTGLWKLFELR